MAGFGIKTRRLAKIWPTRGKNRGKSAISADIATCAANLAKKRKSPVFMRQANDEA
jgi:hypothetical protein